MLRKLKYLYQGIFNGFNTGPRHPLMQEFGEAPKYVLETQRQNKSYMLYLLFLPVLWGEWYKRRSIELIHTEGDPRVRVEQERFEARKEIRSERRAKREEERELKELNKKKRFDGYKEYLKTLEAEVDQEEAIVALKKETQAKWKAYLEDYFKDDADLGGQDMQQVAEKFTTFIQGSQSPEQIDILRKKPEIKSTVESLLARDAQAAYEGHMKWEAEKMKNDGKNRPPISKVFSVATSQNKEISKVASSTSNANNSSSNSSSKGATSPSVGTVNASSDVSSGHHQDYKYVLVGGGTASYAALKAILKHDREAQVLMLSKESYPPYARPPLSKELWRSPDSNPRDSLSYLGWNGKMMNVMYEADKSFYQSPQVTLLNNVEVTNLDLNKQNISLTDGREFGFGKILLATGGLPRVLPGHDNFPGQLTTFRTIDDFKNLYSDVKVKKSPLDIAIVGGSFLGTELAMSLCNIDPDGSSKKPGAAPGCYHKITQIFLEPEPLARNIPIYLSQAVSHELQTAGITLKPNSNVVKVAKSDADPNKVRLELDTGAVLDADRVITCMGIYPETSIAENAGLEIDRKNGGIVANAELEARKNVFVAGDVVSYHDVVLGGRRRSEHHLHALATGRRAGLNMALGSSEKKPFEEVTSLWSEIGNISWEAVGNIDSRLKTVSKWDGVSIQQPGSMWSQAPGRSVIGQLNKGVVYYLNDKKVVSGVLLWNVKNKTELAKQVVSEKKEVKDEQELLKRVPLE